MPTWLRIYSYDYQYCLGLLAKRLPEAEATRMNMVMIVDEIEEEEDGGRRGRRKRTKLMKESKQQIRKGSRKQVMTGMVVRTNEQEFHPRVNK